MKKKNKTGESTLADFKACYKATAYYWHNRYKDLQNSIESLEIKAGMYSQLTLDSGVKNTQWGKAVFSINDVGKIRYSHANKLNRTPVLYPSQNLTSSELKMSM